MRAHAGPAVAAGALDVLAALIELLSRLIGDDLATGLVEQTLRDGAPGPGAPPAALTAAAVGEPLAEP